MTPALQGAAIGYLVFMAWTVFLIVFARPRWIWPDRDVMLRMSISLTLAGAAVGYLAGS